MLLLSILVIFFNSCKKDNNRTTIPVDNSSLYPDSIGINYLLHQKVNIAFEDKSGNTITQDEMKNNTLSVGCDDHFDMVSLYYGGIRFDHTYGGLEIYFEVHLPDGINLITTGAPASFMRVRLKTEGFTVTTPYTTGSTYRTVDVNTAILKRTYTDATTGVVMKVYKITGFTDMDEMEYCFSSALETYLRLSTDCDMVPIIYTSSPSYIYHEYANQKITPYIGVGGLDTYPPSSSKDQAVAVDFSVLMASLCMGSSFPITSQYTEIRYKKSSAPAHSPYLPARKNRSSEALDTTYFTLFDDTVYIPKSKQPAPYNTSAHYGGGGKYYNFQFRSIIDTVGGVPVYSDWIPIYPEIKVP